MIQKRPIHNSGIKKELIFAILFFSSVNIAVGILLHTNAIQDFLVSDNCILSMSLFSSVVVLIVQSKFSHQGVPANNNKNSSNMPHNKVEKSENDLALVMTIPFYILPVKWLIEYIIGLKNQSMSISIIFGIAVLVSFSLWINYLTNKQAAKNIYNLFVNLFGMTAFLLLIFFFLEAGTRILVWQSILPDIPHFQDIQESAPSHCPEGDFPGHPSEIQKWFRLKLTEFEDTELWGREDFAGKYYSITNHVRGTTDQPETYEHTIYIFGGSTMFSEDAFDYYTIPSYIQRLINQELTTTYRVVNMSMIGASTFPQNILLRTIDLKPDDIVIYYDGENNIDRRTSFFVYQENPIPVAEIKSDHKEDSPFPFLVDLKFTLLDSLYKLLFQISKKSSFFHYLRTYNWRLLSARVNDPVWQQGIVNPAVESYQQMLIEANEYILSKGARFFHYIQPTLFAQDEFTEHEQKIIDSFGKDYTYVATQQKMVEENVILTEMGIHSVDLTDVLAIENRPHGADVYYDHCHINYIGNQIVAEAIFNDLKPYLEK
jgi:hypothetical protein